jgi:chromosome segregation ATPase
MCVCVQINYADMLKRVEPLRDELHSLELQAQENKNRGEEVTNLIMQLEHSIASYKEEYAQLISQAQAIKTDLENVQAKVQSVRLLYLRWRNVNLILSCPYFFQPHFYQLQIILRKKKKLCPR